MTDEARLQRWIDSRESSSVHLDADTLTRHAAGQLSPAKAQMVEDHLEVCDDGRCPEFLRTQAMDQEAASDRIPTGELSAIDGARPRTFRSREIVWATFESMSREMGVPIDELVNEAMDAYARTRGYGSSAVPEQSVPPPRRRDPFEETRDAPSHLRGHAEDEDDVDDLARTAAREAHARPPTFRPSNAPSSNRSNPPMIRPSTPMNPGRLPPPPSRSSMPGAPPPPPSRRAMPHTERMPPQQTAPARGPTPTPQSVRQLVLEYRGQAYTVDKDRFLIGRSKTQADLRLDDPNVSRQHAVIERVGAAWYIVDLGSTNGIHISGERVARRALTDTDLIVITTHEIRCSFR
jgi:hypothetical protein